MSKTLDVLQHEFVTIRTGRASPGLVDRIKVDSYGTSLPLKQLASIACPEPRLITIKPWDRNLIPEIEKAILRSGIGLTPSNDGVAIKLPIPTLTEERRNELVKIVRKVAEESKVALRNIRRDAIAEIKELEGISEDDEHRADKEIQHITDEYTDKLEEILSRKEKEIMEE
ncbi:MAG: ribosome recycling factor [bacterium]|nr:ribosome recycling factor [bacterium]